MSEPYKVDREDLILLLVDATQRLTGARELRGITRLEKFLYLLGREERLKDVNDHYAFEAYKFGPFSKEVYSATEFLRGLNLLEITERPVVSHYATTGETRLAEEIGDEEEEVPAVEAREKVYTLTEPGQRAAKSLREVWEKSKGADLKKIDSVVGRYGNLPLNQLIRYVYRKFPDSAKNSVHPEAANL